MCLDLSIIIKTHILLHYKEKVEQFKWASKVNTEQNGASKIVNN